jgi:hypothetical protein
LQLRVWLAGWRVAGRRDNDNLMGGWCEWVQDGVVHLIVINDQSPERLAELEAGGTVTSRDGRGAETRERIL